MTSWRLADQRPPEPRRVSDDVVMRFDGIYEIAPERMQRFPQLEMPAWDTFRIVQSRSEYIKWMQRHFADELISAGMEAETGVDHGCAEHGDEGVATARAGGVTPVNRRPA